MNIYGEHIVLRAISEGDAPLLLKMINDPDTERMLGGSSFPISLSAQQNWIQRQSGSNEILRCIIAERTREEVGLGTVILSDIDQKNGSAQVHIKLGIDNCRGKGYGTDALNTIVRYAFAEMRLHCIYADVLEYNIASQKLFEKCGFHKDGLLRGRIYKGGKYIDVIPYSYLKEDGE